MTEEELPAGVQGAKVHCAQCGAWGPWGEDALGAVKAWDERPEGAGT